MILQVYTGGDYKCSAIYGTDGDFQGGTLNSDTATITLIGPYWLDELLDDLNIFDSYCN